MSTNQVTLRAMEDNSDETLVVVAYTYEIPTFSSPQEYFNYVKDARSSGPKMGVYEEIKNDEQLFTERTGTCVKHEAAYKDFE